MSVKIMDIFTIYTDIFSKGCSKTKNILVNKNILIVESMTMQTNQHGHTKSSVELDIQN